MKAKYWVLVVLLVSSILAWWSGLFSEKEPFYIAVSGPMSGKSEANGQAMVQGIQLCLDQINQQGGIHGRPVKLLIFDDQNQPEQAKEIALKITKQTEALAVIGHYTSYASLAAAPIYRQIGIAAVSGSATADEITMGNDWYFRTIFNNSDQGALLANYVRKILNYHEADILFDEDVYGTKLAEAFRQTAELIGLKIRHRWHFDSADGTSFKNTLQDMIATQQASPTRQGIIFLATHSTEAVETIVSLRREGVGPRIQFIGADALSSSHFVKKLGNYPKERTQPGYYSDGTYTTAPFLFEVANESAQHFWRVFSQKYQEKPMITSALYYDAAMVILDAIKKLAPEQMATLEKTRQQVKDNLWQLSRLEDAVEGVTGSLYFDENGDMIKSIPIGVYEKGRAIVAVEQFQLLSNVQNIDDLLQNVLDNQIIQSNGKFMNRARVVYAGIDFNEISEINFRRSVYSADFFLWFRFKGDFDDDNIEFVNMLNPDTRLGKPVVEQSFGGGFAPSPDVLVTAVVEEHLASNENEVMQNPDSSLGKPIVEQSHEGLTIRSYRVKSVFKADFDFHDYPRDKQVLPISFRHKALTRDKLIYVVDAQGMQLSQFDPQHIKKSTRKFFKQGGLQVNKVLFFQNSHTNDSTLGLPNLFDEQQRIEHSQFNAAISVERNVSNFVLKTLLPVLFLIALGYFSFYLTAFTPKLAIGTNLILATSLFHLKLSSDLSNIDYIILIEYFFYLVYLLAIFVIIVSVFFHRAEDAKDDAEDEKTKLFLKRTNLFGKIFYPIILFAGAGAIAFS